MVLHQKVVTGSTAIDLGTVLKIRLLRPFRADRSKRAQNGHPPLQIRIDIAKMCAKGIFFPRVGAKDPNLTAVPKC